MRRLGSLLAVVSVLLIAPAAVQAAGPATFVRADGGTYEAALYPDGLTIYATSPAYIALPRSGATASVEAYAAHYNFAAVAVRDRRGGRDGEDCFVDAHVITASPFVSDFASGPDEYRGFIMQYATWFFLHGRTNAKDCATARPRSPVRPMFTSARGSGSLSFDCLVRRCRGTFSTFGPPGSCAKPIAVPPGHLGCLPVTNGRFSLVGGLSGSLSVKLFGRSTRATVVAIAVNGKLVMVGPLSSLPRPQLLPPRPHPATLSAACPVLASLGKPVAVTGTLRPGGPGVPITLTFTGPAGDSSTVSARAVAPGSYSARFTPRTPGGWTMRATFGGDRTRHAATSPPCHFTAS